MWTVQLIQLHQSSVWLQNWYIYLLSSGEIYSLSQCDVLIPVLHHGAVEVLISTICVISTKEETANEVAAVPMHTVRLSGLVLIVTDNEKLDCNQK